MLKTICSKILEIDVTNEDKLTKESIAEIFKWYYTGKVPCIRAFHDFLWFWQKHDSIVELIDEWLLKGRKSLRAQRRCKEIIDARLSKG